MTRALLAMTLALGLAALGCNTATPPEGDPETGGASGDDTGGTGGGKATGGTGGSKATGGTGGSTATGGTGGDSAGTGGSSTGGAGGESTDGPTASDAPAADAPAGEAGADPGGEMVANKAWIRLCPKEWDKTKCCAFLCTCLKANCTDSPQDAPRIPNCMAMCNGLGEPRARCQVYHCFESLSPNNQKDHASHCGHASGRVGGGGCPYDH
jgi:hypothetical protein